MAMISEKKIKEQLNGMLESPEFMAAERLGLFLRYVVEQTMSGHSDRIKQYTIAVDALGYGPDFDPQTDSIIRIQARRLRRALDRYSQGPGVADPIKIEIPKGAYIPVFFDNKIASAVPDSADCPSSVPAKTPHDLTEPAIAVFMFENLNGNDQNSFFTRGLTAEI